jgi:hypothetical protein
VHIARTPERSSVVSRPAIDESTIDEIRDVISDGPDTVLLLVRVVLLEGRSRSGSPHPRSHGRSNVCAALSRPAQARKVGATDRAFVLSRR